MKPAKFDYHAPTTVGQALELLGRYGGDAKVLAGGQSLMPLLNFRLSRPAALVDLNRIPSLAYIREEKGRVSFGAMTRQRTVEFSPVVKERGALPRGGGAAGARPPADPHPRHHRRLDRARRPLRRVSGGAERARGRSRRARP